MLNENAATDKQETHYIVVVLHKLCSCAQLCYTNYTNPRADKTPAAASLEFHTKKINKNHFCNFIDSKVQRTVATSNHTVMAPSKVTPGQSMI